MCKLKASKGLLTWVRLIGLARLPEPFLRNFSPVYEMRKGRRSWERILVRNSVNKANMTKHTLPVTGLKCSYGQIFGSASYVPVKKPSKPALSYDMNTSKFRNPGLPGQACSCEEALSSNFRVCKWNASPVTRGLVLHSVICFKLDLKASFVYVS